MQTDTIQSIEINKEKREISKYAGLVFGRVLLLIELFFLLFLLRPVSIYLFTFFLLFPWIFSNILSSKSEEAKQPLLFSCAKKFYYTPFRYRAEKLTGKMILFFLVVWQISLNQTISYPVLLQLAPGIILLTYILGRIICTVMMRRKIHLYYTNFLSL